MRALAEAVTECEVTKVPKVFVERAIRREPLVAFKLMTLLELRLVQYEELVKCLWPRETEVRLANLLPILAQKFGEKRDGAVTIDLRLTHQDLAAMVASTRESVTKVLNEMRNRDLIEIESGRITLKDSRPREARPSLTLVSQVEWVVALQCPPGLLPESRLAKRQPGKSPTAKS